jgi:mediator of RNA polymerase II transcription subunit 4
MANSHLEIALQWQMSNDRTNASPSNPVKDGVSMSSVLLAPLNELQSLSHTLFLSLSPIQSKPPPPPPLSSFLTCDEALSSAINLARKHQIRQRRIDALEKEILESDARWFEIMSELESGRKELEEVIKEGDERIKAIEQAEKSMIFSIYNRCLYPQAFLIVSIPYPELLAYAQSISAFTSAPPNMPDLSLPGQPPPPLFFPPFPNEEKMRRGHLNAEAPLGLLGETHSVGRRKNIVTSHFPVLTSEQHQQSHQSLPTSISIYMVRTHIDKTFVQLNRNFSIWIWT